MNKISFNVFENYSNEAPEEKLYACAFFSDFLSSKKLDCHALTENNPFANSISFKVGEIYGTNNK